MTYGSPPINLGRVDIGLSEVMYYLYLPVCMPGKDRLSRLPANLCCVQQLIKRAIVHASLGGRDVNEDYVYVSARKGWATPDNPLNRPGWHCDGFGTDDLNFLWWSGAGTRFALGDFGNVPLDHKESLAHFEKMINWTLIGAETRIEVKGDYPEARLYAIDPHVVHATPIIEVGQWRQYVKVSISRHRYNLENNSHNYLFEYDWPMHGREEVRNDTHTAQRDYT